MELEEVEMSRHFFKVLVTGFQEKLNLPPAFCKEMKQEKSEWAMLKSHRGRWKVKVSRDGEGLISFQLGWPQFVNQHSLSFGDFLLFQHVGGFNFNVLIFDPTCCEKHYSALLQDSSLNRRRPIKRERDEKASDMSRKPHFTMTMQPHHAAIKYRLNIPIEFVRSNIKIWEKASGAILRNEGGGEWATGLSVRKVGQLRVFVGKGWRDFYESNELKRGDVCVFYLNSTSPATILFDVKICPKS